MGDGERQHQPPNRQSERFVREGVDISLSTLADLIGHACVALAPIHALIGSRFVRLLSGPSASRMRIASPGPGVSRWMPC